MPPILRLARPVLCTPRFVQLQIHRPVATAASPAQRSLFLHVRPPPQTLEQRRAVLRAVERFGPTDFFRKTASNDSFMCIASSTQMANALLKESPMEVGVDTLPPSNPSLSLPGRPVPLSQTEKTGKTVISVFPSPSYPHRATIRSGPLYGPWPADIAPDLATSPSLKNTLVYNALRGVVPESAWAEGMCDWRPRVVAAANSSKSKEARIRDRRGRRSYVQRSVLSGLAEGRLGGQRATRSEQHTATEEGN